MAIDRPLCRKDGSMHGFILSGLQSYVLSSQDPQTWARIERYAGMDESPVRGAVYSDAEGLALLEAAAHLTGKPMKGFLEAFGEFLAFPLLARFREVLRPEWRTLDVLRHAEEIIHVALRQLGLGSGAPHLCCHEVFASTVVIEYVSPRRLCALAIGLSRGIARNFREELEINELRCIHRGHESCLLSFRLVDGATHAIAERRSRPRRGAMSQEVATRLAKGPKRARQRRRPGDFAS